MGPERLLITGGLGFIGSQAAMYFTKKGYEVTVIDNLSRPTDHLIDEKTAHYNLNLFKTQFPQIHIEIEDIRDFSKMGEIFQKYVPNYVIHAAGQTSAVGSIEDPSNDFSNNVVGAFNILECARKQEEMHGFIYLSSNKVYGENANNFPLKEKILRYTPTENSFTGISRKYSIDQTQHTPYGISKLTGDLYAQEYRQSYNLKTIVFRMSCIYGPGQFGFEEQGWISHILTQIIKNKEISIFGSGKQVRDILYIDDLLQLFDMSFHRLKTDENSDDSSKSYVFNVGGGIYSSLSPLELLDLASNLSNPDSNESYYSQTIKNTAKLNISFHDWRPGDQKYYVSDIAKVIRKFKWYPSTKPRDGVEKTFNWLQEHQDFFV